MNATVKQSRVGSGELWRWALSAASVAAVLGIWQGVSVSGLVPRALFPPPTDVARALNGWLEGGALLRDVTASIWRALLGLGAGALVGVVLGLLTGRIAPVRLVVSPVIHLLRPLPPVALIPLMIVWFGIDDRAKVVSIAAAVFFPVWTAAHAACHSIPKTYLWAAQSLHVGMTRTLFMVILPSTAHTVLAGIRIGIAMAFVMVFVSELAGASSGVGYQISVTHLAYRIDAMMAALAVLGLCAATTDQVLLRGAYLLFPWLRYAEVR